MNSLFDHGKMKIAALFVVFGAILLSFPVARVFGFNPGTLSGFAWAEGCVNGSWGTPCPSSYSPAGGMGWLSFNWQNAGLSGVVPYGVSVDANGYLSGSAWSDNYGWVKFDNDCPSGFVGAKVGSAIFSPGQICGTGHGSRIVTSGGISGNPDTIVGWARVLSAVSAGTNSGGWDGWISLSGHNDQDFTAAGIQTSPYAYGISFNNTSGAFSGYAWGSEVVGWMNLSGVILTGANTSACTISAAGSFSVPIAANNVNVTQTITVAFNTGSVTAGSLMVEPVPFSAGGATISSSFVPVSVSSASGQSTIHLNSANLPSAIGSYPFDIVVRQTVPGGQEYCRQGFTLDYGVAAPNTTDLVLAPTGGFEAYPDSSGNFMTELISSTTATNFVQVGGSTQAYNGGATSTTTANSPAWNNWESANPNSICPTPGSPVTYGNIPVPNDPTTYKLTCHTATGEAQTALVTITKADVHASLNPIPACIVAGDGTNGKISWSSTAASSCTGTGFSTGSATSGGPITVLNNPASATPTIAVGDHVYSLSCLGQDGTSNASATATLSVQPQGGSCSAPGGHVVPIYIEH